MKNVFVVEFTEDGSKEDSHLVVAKTPEQAETFYLNSIKGSVLDQKYTLRVLGDKSMSEPILRTPDGHISIKEALEMTRGEPLPYVVARLGVNRHE